VSGNLAQLAVTATASDDLALVHASKSGDVAAFDQTAEALDLSLTAVKARSWRARLQLRERLSKYFKKTEESVGVEPGKGNRDPVLESTMIELRARARGGEKKDNFLSFR
jgi:hypothetical protein